MAGDPDGEEPRPRQRSTSPRRLDEAAGHGGRRAIACCSTGERERARVRFHDAAVLYRRLLGGGAARRLRPAGRHAQGGGAERVGTGGGGYVRALHLQTESPVAAYALRDLRARGRRRRTARRLAQRLRTADDAFRRAAEAIAAIADRDPQRTASRPSRPSSADFEGARRAPDGRAHRGHGADAARARRRPAASLSRALAPAPALMRRALAARARRRRRRGGARLPAGRRRARLPALPRRRRASSARPSTSRSTAAGVVPARSACGSRARRTRAVFARVPLLALTGGPGQPGVAFGPVWQAALEGVGRATASSCSTCAAPAAPAGCVCPELQRQALTDVTVRAPGTVEACAARLGPARDAYATTETVEDLEARARGARRASASRWSASPTARTTRCATRAPTPTASSG